MADALQILKQYFGYDAFRPGQRELIDSLLAGRDALGVMPTGAGKSLCYQVPALLLPGITLVVSPLISLMADQVGVLFAADIPAAYLNSSLTAAQQSTVLHRAAQGQYKLLYVAPERLCTPGFLSFARQTQISMVAVDEAHCISQWGQDFRPSYLRIPAFLDALPARPLLSAFTATATAEVRQDIIRLLGLRQPYLLTTGFDRQNLYFAVQHPVNKPAALKALLVARQEQSGIVYCATRKTTEEVCALLVTWGFDAACYHAGLDKAVRRQNQEDFLYDRKKIIVATNAFGMGIDKSNVAFVIHYNMPKSMESYYQEAGRAGRDGSPADCILLFSPQDVRTGQFFIAHSREALDEATRRIVRARDEQRLQKMTGYCNTTACLRQFILRYFDEQAPDTCTNCANCAAYQTLDATIDAQKILSCVYRLRERGRTAGRLLLIDILRGVQSERIRKNGYDSLSTYGIMRDTPVKLLRHLLDELTDAGYLTLSDGEYPVIQLCARANEIIRARKPFVIRVPKALEDAPPRRETHTDDKLKGRLCRLARRLRAFRAGR